MSFNWRIYYYSGLFTWFYCHDRSTWSGYVDFSQANFILWYASRWHLLISTSFWAHESFFSHIACETRDKNNLAWIITVSFCLCAQFLLISSQGDTDIRIISITEQVETWANPMPIILAETIIGLDSFKEQNRLSGSLLLLQVCNQNLFF